MADILSGAVEQPGDIYTYINDNIISNDPTLKYVKIPTLAEATGSLSEGQRNNLSELVNKAIGMLDAAWNSPTKRYVYSLDNTPWPSWITDSPVASEIVSSAFDRYLLDPLTEASDGAERTQSAIAQAYLHRQDFSVYNGVLTGDIPAGTLPGMLWQGYWALRSGNITNALYYVNMYNLATESKAARQGKAN
jgi:hypothetical protein